MTMRTDSVIRYVPVEDRGYAYAVEVWRDWFRSAEILQRQAPHHPRAGGVKPNRSSRRALSIERQLLRDASRRDYVMRSIPADVIEAARVDAKELHEDWLARNPCDCDACAPAAESAA